MNRSDLIKRVTNDKPGFDARERVELFFQNEDPSDPKSPGTWNWQYTLETSGGRFISRRIGTTGLNNPKIKPTHLHRALCNDSTLGIFVPEISKWFKPGGGRDVGWAFMQDQFLDRAHRIEQELESS